jgi:hypothetical protein
MLRFGGELAMLGGGAMVAGFGTVAIDAVGMLGGGGKLACVAIGRVAGIVTPSGGMLEFGAGIMFGSEVIATGICIWGA